MMIRQTLEKVFVVRGHCMHRFINCVRYFEIQQKYTKLPLSNEYKFFVLPYLSTTSIG